jgi:general secretion pathway protein F
MLTYHYKAVDADGTTAQGTVDAPTRDVALEHLRRRGINPIALSKSTPKDFSALWRTHAFQQDKLPLADLRFFARQLANLLTAGSDLDRSMQVMAGLTTKRRVKSTLDSLSSDIRSGKSFAESLRRSKARIPPFFIGMVQAGEMVGRLPTTLERLADILDRTFQTRTRLSSALIYPALLLLSTLAAVLLIMIVVVPQFEPLFAQAKADLPLLTRIVMAISRQAAGLVPMLLLAVLVLPLSFIFWRRQERGRAVSDSLLLSVPVFGKIVLNAEMSRACFILGGLLQGDVPLLSALLIAGDAMTNQRLALGLKAAGNLVEQGVQLAAAMKHQGIFPRLLIEMTVVAEESATLDRTFFELGRIYDEMADVALQRLVSLITPLATIFLGGFVAVILAAVLLAVLKINDLAI